MRTAVDSVCAEMLTSDPNSAGHSEDSGSQKAPSATYDTLGRVIAMAMAMAMIPIDTALRFDHIDLT